MKWTKEKPTAAGWWWQRYFPDWMDGEPISSVVKVEPHWETSELGVDDEEGWCFLSTEFGEGQEWSDAPVPEPEEPAHD